MLNTILVTMPAKFWHTNYAKRPGQWGASSIGRKGHSPASLQICMRSQGSRDAAELTPLPMEAVAPRSSNTTRRLVKVQTQKDVTFAGVRKPCHIMAGDMIGTRFRPQLDKPECTPRGRTPSNDAKSSDAHHCRQTAQTQMVTTQ